MKKLFFLNLLFLFSIATAQIKFEKGYFITNDGEKHEVLIKNEDWLHNPTEFKYKNAETDSEKTGKISDVKEFQVYGYNKLVRYVGNIDISSNDLQNLSTKEEPEWKKIEVFLYELSSGNKSLYSFYGKSNQKFFYSNNIGEINPLIYKEYSQGDSSFMYKNETYKTQLKNIFSDNSAVLKLIENTKYESMDLIKIFNQYNNISDEESKLYVKRNNSKFNLYLKPGINFINLNIYGPTMPETYDASFSSIELKYGIEAEYILPFNKNKWSLFVESVYNSLKSETKSKDGINTINVDYSFIEFPVGIKHYMYLNQTSKFFAYVKVPLFTTVTKTGTLNYTSTYHDNNLELKKITTNFSFGAGYIYKDKFSVELSYAMKRSISNYVSWGSAMSVTSINLGYNIF